MAKRPGGYIYPPGRFVCVTRPLFRLYSRTVNRAVFLFLFLSSVDITQYTILGIVIANRGARTWRFRV